MVLSVENCREYGDPDVFYEFSRFEKVDTWMEAIVKSYCGEWVNEDLDPWCPRNLSFLDKNGGKRWITKDGICPVKEAEQNILYLRDNVKYQYRKFLSNGIKIKVDLAKSECEIEWEGYLNDVDGSPWKSRWPD